VLKGKDSSFPLSRTILTSGHTKLWFRSIPERSSTSFPWIFDVMTMRSTGPAAGVTLMTWAVDLVGSAANTVRTKVLDR